MYEGGLPLADVNGLQMYEWEGLLEGVMLRSRAIWEANRMTAYVCAQSHSKQKMKPTALVKFPWERKQQKEHVEEGTRGVDEEYKAVMRQGMEGMARAMSEEFQLKNGK